MLSIFDLDHAYQLNLTKAAWEWEELARMPNPRYNHATLYDNDRMFVFIGKNGIYFEHAIDMFDMLEKTWTTLPEQSSLHKSGVGAAKWG